MNRECMIYVGCPLLFVPCIVCFAYEVVNFFVCVVCVDVSVYMFACASVCVCMWCMRRLCKQKSAAFFLSLCICTCALILPYDCVCYESACVSYYFSSSLFHSSCSVSLALSLQPAVLLKCVWCVLFVHKIKICL